MIASTRVGRSRRNPKNPDSARAAWRARRDATSGRDARTTTATGERGAVGRRIARVGAPVAVARRRSRGRRATPHGVECGKTPKPATRVTRGTRDAGGRATTRTRRGRRGRHRDDAMGGRVGARASQRRVVSQAPRAPPAVGASARRWRAFPGDRASRRALAGRARDDASVARATDSCGRGRRTHRASTS